MFYHHHSFEYQVTNRLLHLLTRKPLQQLLNEVDGVGNPKGDVYTRRELEELLGRFRDLEIFAGHIAVPKTRFILPSSRTNPLGRRFGWFLYARGRKPVR